MTIYDVYLMQPVLYYQENITLAIVTLFQEKAFMIEFIMFVYYKYLRVESYYLSATSWREQVTI